jgi:hypothetical protein
MLAIGVRTSAENDLRTIVPSDSDTTQALAVIGCAWTFPRLKNRVNKHNIENTLCNNLDTPQ